MAKQVARYLKIRKADRLKRAKETYQLQESRIYDALSAKVRKRLGYPLKGAQKKAKQMLKKASSPTTKPVKKPASPAKSAPIDYAAGMANQILYSMASEAAMNPE